MLEESKKKCHAVTNVDTLFTRTGHMHLTNRRLTCHELCGWTRLISLWLLLHIKGFLICLKQ